MLVRVNGVERELADGTTVAALVAGLGAAGVGRGVAADGRGVAVAIAGEVVPRSAWAATALVSGAAVEVLVAVQGG
jgi:sulfur carrier protein